MVAGLKKILGADNTLLGVKAGPKGLIEGKLFEITDQAVIGIINTGGFDFLGSDRTKIKTDAQFDAIRKTKRGHGGELVLLDAIFLLMKKRPAYARLIEGEYFDTGSKLGWLEANLRFALEREDMKDGVRKLMKRITKN